MSNARFIDVTYIAVKLAKIWDALIETGEPLANIREQPRGL